MKLNIATLLALLVLSVIPAASFAASVSLTSAQSTFVSQYVPIGVIANATFYNQTVGANNYIVMKLGGQYKYAIFNFSGKSAMLLNASQIQPILEPYLDTIFYPNATTFNSLTTLMTNFVNSGKGTLNDCIVETGLSNPVGGCTYANNCQSCRTVPACNYVLGQSGGPSYPFAVGIMNFSVNYTMLNNSYSTYFTALKNTNKSNIYAQVDTLYGSVQNIIGTATAIGQNPIFPLPGNFSLALLQSCHYTATPLSQPYYCVVANGGSGFCNSLKFNWSAINKLNQTILQLDTLPISGYSAYAEALNSSTLAHSYLSVFSTQQQNLTFGAYLKAVTPQYNALLSNVISLTNRTTNASLSASLRNLQAVYISIKGSGASLNLSYANKTLNAALTNTSRLYLKVKALYQPVYNLAQNNTAKITVEQLNYRTVPPYIGALALQQQQINMKLNGVVNATQLPVLLRQLQGISNQLSLSGPLLDLPSLVKSIDGGIVSAMLAGGTATIASRNAGAPAYAAIISLIIGIVLVALFYMLTYHRLKRRQRIHMHAGVKRAWDMLFIILFILVIAFTYLTYSAAASANQFLPVSGFLSAAHASKSVYIAYNTSAANTTATSACVSSLKAQFASQNTITTTLTVIGVSCLSSSNRSLAGTDCYANVLSSMKPVIQVEPGQNSTILYSGMYGTLLHIGGSASSGSSCPVAAILSTR